MEQIRAHIFLTPKKLSAHNVSVLGLALMVVLMSLSFLLSAIDRVLGAAILQVASFLSLMSVGIAMVFVPSDSTLSRRIGMVNGLLLACMSLGIALFVLRALPP